MHTETEWEREIACAAIKRLRESDVKLIRLLAAQVLRNIVRVTLLVTIVLTKHNSRERRAEDHGLAEVQQQNVRKQSVLTQVGLLVHALFQHKTVLKPLRRKKKKKKRRRNRPGKARVGEKQSNELTSSARKEL